MNSFVEESFFRFRIPFCGKHFTAVSNVSATSQKEKNGCSRLLPWCRLVIVVALFLPDLTNLFVPNSNSPSPIMFAPTKNFSQNQTCRPRPGSSKQATRGS